MNAFIYRDHSGRLGFRWNQGENRRGDHPHPRHGYEGPKNLCPSRLSQLSKRLRVFGRQGSGHTVEEKTELLKQLWGMFQNLTGLATDQIAISLQEVPSSNAMEMGQIM